MNRGKYIVLEGGEAVSKTTQARLLAPTIGGLAVHEPGGTALGDPLRSLLLDPEIDTSPMTDILLHAASRSELLNSVIRPTLDSGQHVVSDRSWLSSLAYQGAQEMPIDQIKKVNTLALGPFASHDLVILLDTDPAMTHQRLGGKRDYYEKMGREYHQVVRDLYLKIAPELGAVIIDAMQPVETVQTEIRETVFDRLGV